MENRYVTDLEELMDPFVTERVEQVLMEVERNPNKYPDRARYHAEYVEHLNAMVCSHPELRMALDSLVDSICLRSAAEARESYRQGACDCAEFLRRLFHSSRKTPKRAEA